MKIKPIGTFINETDWKTGQKVKVTQVDPTAEHIYPLGKVFVLQETGGSVHIPGAWNGFSAELQLVEEKGQLEFDL